MHRHARHFVAVSILAIALGCGALAALAQPRTGLSPDAEAVYTRWVVAMCIGGDEAELAAALRRFGPELVPAFERAIASGPSSEDVRAVRAAAADLYARRARMPLDDIPVTGVSRADLQRFRGMSRGAFVEDQVRRFATGYRANAVAALGIIGGDRARSTLARLARSDNDPLAPPAREALRVMRAPR
ncbi:MAG: hypothetical protein ABI920_02920 [Casimicrobiaceae bacterium]